MHMDISQEALYTEIYRQKAADQEQAKLTAQTLCEPAQSKFTWTCKKSHFMQKFTGKMPRPRVSTSIKHRPLPLPQDPLSVDTLFGEKDRKVMSCPITWIVINDFSWLFYLSVEATIPIESVDISWSIKRTEDHCNRHDQGLHVHSIFENTSPSWLEMASTTHKYMVPWGWFMMLSEKGFTAFLAASR